MKINLNATIKVKLTDHGKYIFYHQYDEFNEMLGFEYIKPHHPECDADGYTEFQLWEFMNLYGQHFVMGASDDLDVIKPLEIIVEEEL